MCVYFFWDVARTGHRSQYYTLHMLILLYFKKVSCYVNDSPKLFITCIFITK